MATLSWQKAVESRGQVLEGLLLPHCSTISPWSTITIFLPLPRRCGSVDRASERSQSGATLLTRLKEIGKIRSEK